MGAAGARVVVEALMAEAQVDGLSQSHQDGAQEVAVETQDGAQEVEAQVDGQSQSHQAGAREVVVEAPMVEAQVDGLSQSHQDGAQEVVVETQDGRQVSTKVDFLYQQQRWTVLQVFGRTGLGLSRALMLWC